MKQGTLSIGDPQCGELQIPLTTVHTLVIGSGAAGLNAAVQLRANSVDDVLIITEGLEKGTSINTGSDKQTYYKLSMCGSDADSPIAMAQTYFDGGGMHGDLALVEASLSARAFIHLVNQGVPFPRDAYGEFVGYKTDHDPRRRATSIGPYTSREMCRALIRRVEQLSIPALQGRTVVELLIAERPGSRRAVGAIAIGPDGAQEIYLAENIVFAVGGPGGLYRTSVYPEVHTGAIGLALKAGVRARGLPESQYGLASTSFRWNVSGTYMQVIPRFISTGADGSSDEREFLPDYFGSVGEMNSNVFLKGYQWPFDSHKVIGGSSIIDILVYIENVQRERRVFLDFRCNPTHFSFDDLSAEARDYLTRSDALLPTPLERLRKMNPGAVQLYLEHGIDIGAEPLEVAVCAQHNNGGLAGDHWWQSVNTSHLFPVGEVNGSHGIYRPGGSALNSGQVGSFRAAEFIANRCADWTLPGDEARELAAAAVKNMRAWLARCPKAAPWQAERDELQARMSRAGAHIRRDADLREATREAWRQVERIEQQGCAFTDPEGMVESLKNRYLAFAHAVYLEALLFSVRNGVGSRGSAIVLSENGLRVHDGLGEEWSIAPEDEDFRQQVLETVASGAASVTNEWIPRRPIPESDPWFETAWAEFREGRIYDT